MEAARGGEPGGLSQGWLEGFCVWVCGSRTSRQWKIALIDNEAAFG